MDSRGFWLLAVEDSTVTVSLLTPNNDSYSIFSVGTKQPWTDQEDSLLLAIDTSLSDAAATKELPEDQEPSDVAFIVPPLWVGPDGKIIPPRLKLIETICQKLKFRPLGFMSSEEAITQEANIAEGVPASFISLHLSNQDLSLTLVYLGKIHQTVKRLFVNGFNPNLLEAALIELKTDSALPPLILIWGQTTADQIQAIKDFPWVGKKNVETFLHLPEIRSRSPLESINIFAKAIIAQIGQNHPVDITPPLPEVEEVPAAQLGFVDTTDQPQELPSPPLPPPPPPPRSSPKLTLPSIHLPSIRLPRLQIIIPFIVFLPLLSLGLLLYFASASLTILVSPIEFNHQSPVILDAATKSFDAANLVIPVQAKDFDVKVSESVPASGQKTIGDHAKGEVTIYNRQEKGLTLPKGTVLLDAANRQYLLTTSTQIATSTANLDQGIITMGISKVIVQAADIGPESNLAKDTILKFKDAANSSLLAKTSQNLTGGSKQQVSAINAVDKVNLETKISQAIKSQIDTQVNDNVNQLSGLIKETIKINQGRINFNREIGEAADQLTGDISANITAFIIDQSIIPQIITAILDSDPNFNQVTINPADFQLQYSIKELSNNRATGSLSVTGHALPKIDTTLWQKTLAGQKQNQALDLIKSKINRAYGINLQISPGIYKLLHRLPPRSSRISIEVKSQ